MQVVDSLLMVFEYITVVYFGLSGFYIFVFSLAGCFYKSSDQNLYRIQNRIAVLIPAYKEDAVILETARLALQQNYPQHRFDIIVIADSLEDDTIDALKSLPIIICQVQFDKSTKVKALNRAMDALSPIYDYLVILDADNIMEPDFLRKINDAFNRGYRIVQGHRTAKNKNTAFAILDAASEEINNHIFRKGHRALGLSSGLIGSGMGFEYGLLKSVMKSVSAVGGFDKELEFMFARKHIEIEYLQDAFVYDEKIQSPTGFSTQRKRWLSTQFVYLRKYFARSLKELLFRGNLNMFDKAFQLIIPPRVLLVGITFILALISCILNFGLDLNTHVHIAFWILNLVLTALAFLMALPKTFYNTNTLKALQYLPSAFIRMFMLLFKLKGANKTFIHTVHGSIKN
jgi:cellulose synthase/poly-beta-1,6-N-acetylglucosamine synthase-like glycosyltransferase